MNRYFALVVVVLMVLGAFAVGGGAGVAAGAPESGPRWIPFDQESLPAEPSMRVLSASPEQVDLQAVIPGCFATDMEAAGERYVLLSGEGFGHGREVGLPDLPILRRDVEIPFGAQVAVEVLEAEFSEHSLSELGLSGALYPLQPSLPKIDLVQPGAPPFSVDEAFYRTDAFYPAAPVVVTNEFIVRGHRAIEVEVWPVSYNPASGRVRLYHTIHFRLRLTGSDMAHTQALARRYASPAFEPWLADNLLNHASLGPNAYGRSDASVGYLIVTADAYYNAMLPFVTLKQDQGFAVTMVRTSEIPGGATTTAIQSYIQNAYHNWAIPPSFVLLVGDTDTIPTWTGPVIGTSTDLYYATMDASGTGEWHPDIGRGRFPVRSAAQATIMVNKYLAYASLTGDEPWLMRASFPASCDSSNYDVAEATHNYVISTHTQPRGYTGTFPNNPQPGGDKLYCITYNAGYTNLVNAFNQGRWAIIYSGHGDYTGWEMSFGSNAVRNLTNYGMFPFVASHACLTGNFGQTEVFGETWVLQENKGALAYWGSSTYSYWDEDDILERRAFDSLFGSGYPDVSISTMTYNGLSAVETTYPSSARYYWETYNILGDPALYLFPRQPQAPNLSIGKVAASERVEAGTRLQYTLTVTNSGGAATDVVISDTLPANTLFAGASQGGVLQGDEVVWQGLTLPAGGNLSVTYNVTVTCVPSGTLIVNDDYQVSAAEWPTPTSGLPVTITVVSEGVIADFSSPNPVAVNWSVPFTNLSHNATGYLWAFGDGGFSYAVNPTHAYTSLGSYTVALTATNLCAGAVVTRVLDVEDYAVSLTPTTVSQSGDPGATVTYTLRVTNTGTTNDVVRFTHSGNKWTTAVSPQEVALGSGEGAPVTVTVSVPASAVGGTLDGTRLTVRSLSDPRTPAAQVTAILTTTANTMYGVGLGVGIPEQTAEAGAAVTYTLRVTNTGNTVDTFDFTRVGTGWLTAISPAQLTIARGGWRIIEVVVMVPEGATAATPPDMAVIRAVSQGDPTRTAEVTLTTRATGYRVFLPLTIRDG